MTWVIERRTKTRVYRTAVLAISAAVLISPAAWAQYEENFKQGIRAMDQEHWAAVAEKMRKAASERPEDGKQVTIYGMRQKPYLPSYYLGLALFRLDDCEGAVKAWQESEQRKAVQGMGDIYQSFKHDRDECKKRLDAEQEAKAELAEATKSQEQVKSRGDDSSFREAWAQLKDAQEKETQATNLLDQARALLNKSQTPKSPKQIADLQKAGQLAKSARQSFEKLAEQLDQQRAVILAAKKASDLVAVNEKLRLDAIERLRQQHQEGLHRLKLAVGDAKKVLLRIPAVAPADAEMIQHWQTLLLGLLPTAGKAGDDTSLPEIEQLRSELSAAATSLDKAITKVQSDTGPPPDALRAAASAFLLGHYETVVHTLTLEATSFVKPRAVAARHLLLAAALYALYIEGGGKDAALGRQALEEIYSCRKTKPRISPADKEFSPRFIEFFKTAK